jgi:hypothetical protein
VADVLAVGIYMADRPNTVAHVSLALSQSRRHRVDQHWIAIAPDGRGQFDHPMTRLVVSQTIPKFELLDRLLVDAGAYDWVLICDDDIELRMDVVDALLYHATLFDFALCQPARTIDSFTDHPIVQLLPGVRARRTRFVEIGPLTCLRADAVKLLLPFGPNVGMGWGMDFIWPVIIEAAGLRMGVVDAVPMAHRIRRATTGYDSLHAQRSMFQLLAARKYLPIDEAFTVTEVYT